MFLGYVSQMPHLYSGVDDKGRQWTTLSLPKAFGEHLQGRTPHQRLAIMRGLLADLKRCA